MMTTLMNRFVTDPHNMTMIYILIALLPQLFYTLVHGQESPCPENFKYITKPETNETTGLIEISLPPRTGVELQLNLTLEVAGNLPTGNTGLTLKFLGTSTDIPASKLSFHVDFPLHYPIPEIIGIWFNGERYCSGPNATGNFVTTITLEHTLLLPNMLSAIYSNPGPTTERPSTTIRPPITPTVTLLSHGIRKNNVFMNISDQQLSRYANNIFLYPNARTTQKPTPEPNIFLFPNTISTPQPTPQPTPRPTPKPTSRPTPRPIWRLTSKPNLILKPTSAKPAPQGDDDGDSINNNRECGINSFTHGPNLLIINGYRTSLGQWPWLVALFAKKEDRYNCAGSVLTNKHIITAAHCMISSDLGDNIIRRAPDELLVSLGIFKLTELHKTGNVNREVASYEVHHDYAHTESGDADLAILVLKTSVDYSPVIKPICLWTGSISLENVVGKSGFVVGWGVDEHGNFTADPRLISVPIVSQEVCLRSHQSFFWYSSERTFCAGARDGSGPCNGDSGGGLVILDQGRYHLRGVVSRGVQKNVGEIYVCDLSQYVVYLDVAKYLPWIRKQISTT